MAAFILSAFADEAAKTVRGQIAALTRNGIPHIEPRALKGRYTYQSNDEAFDAPSVPLKRSSPKRDTRNARGTYG